MIVICEELVGFYMQSAPLSLVTPAGCFSQHKGLEQLMCDFLVVSRMVIGKQHTSRNCGIAVLIADLECLRERHERRGKLQTESTVTIRVVRPHDDIVAQFAKAGDTALLPSDFPLFVKVAS